MPQPADSQARQQALDTQHSFAVSAPAGSGKTGLLTQRMLCLLAKANTPEEILCMTFTRKAAGEMRARLVAALVDAQNDLPPANAYEEHNRTLALKALARDRQQGWNLIEAPNRLRILTIDSFCRHLASQLAIDAGIGQLPEPSDSPQMAYRLAVQQVFASLEDKSPVGAALETLLIHFDNDLARLEGLLTRLLSQREQWLSVIFSQGNTRDFLEQALQNLIRESLQNASAQLTERASDIAILADYAAMHLKEHSPEANLSHCCGLIELPDSDEDNIKAWQGIVELLLTQKDEWRKTITKATGFPTKKDALLPTLADQRKAEWIELVTWASQQSGLLATLQDIRALPPASYQYGQWQVLDALTQLLPRLVAELQLIFQQQRSSDFSEITLTALQALGTDDEPTDLTLRLDAQINHILVDEFQDTSSVQFHLLKLLTNGWQNGDGRTLFIVGDGMQSLYSFRNANVGLFLDARQHPIGSLHLQPLDLSVNFRSQANIIDWVNSVFVEAFPPRIDSGRGAVPYTHSNSFKAALPEPAVTIDVLSTEDESSPFKEAELVAQHALEARRQNPSASIAILVRGRRHLREILPALRNHQLDWQATDIDPLSSAMPVIDLVSLTRALLNPADRIAWLSILRAPWCGLGLDDLLAIATTELTDNPTPEKAPYPLLLLQIFHYQNTQGEDGKGLSPAGQQIISRVAKVLDSTWQRRHRKPLRTWIEGCWFALGGPAALGTDGTAPAIALHQCQQYFELLERHTRGAATINDWHSFQYAVDQLYAEPLALKEPLILKEPLATKDPLASEHSLIKELSPPLQIMTIHKSKGLEFDVVILPGLDRKGASNSHELLLWRERVNQAGDNELLLSPPQKLGAVDDTLYTHLKREESIKSRLENTRVLYVACTRAIQRLHLLFRQSGKSPAQDSLLASLWPVLEPHIAASNAKESDDPDQIRHLEHCAITVHETSNARPGTSLGNKQAEGIEEPSNEHLFSFRLPADWQSPFSQGGNETGQAAKAPPVNQTSAKTIATIGKAGDSDARKIGTLFHRTLSLLVIEGIDLWDAPRIQRQQASWKIQMQQAGIIDSSKALSVLNQALQQCLADTEQHWLFNNQHSHSHCELALNYLDSKGDIATVIIDRCFVADGIQWIIDYKTSMPTEGQSIDDFLDQQAQQYLGQLELYAQRLSDMHQQGSFSAETGIETKTPLIKAALYFPLLAQLTIVINQQS